ncbi:hypothetical protein F2Q68_00014195 [Brassica cretica]|uniref:Uncharacterized protein n=1 Tax=Brassica cretica TaxID=69181 RepID=A0A8S9HB26_BRACR|nr:hypothetical protein F2Q68_00014195 [Brassica cretica]
MKTQVMIVVALLIPVALSSNSDMVVEAQLGPGDCYDGCTTGCVQRDPKKTSKCENQCAKRCGRGKYTL